MKNLFNLTLFLMLAFFINECTYAQKQPRTPSKSASATKQFNFSDNKGQTSMMPIMGDALPIIQYIEDTLNVEIVRIEYDLIFDKKVTYRTLYKGWKYGIVAIGDYRIKKINVHLYKWVNEEWKYINSSESTDYFALLTEEPEEQGDYLIQITADEFQEGYKAGHYSVIIYH